MKTIVAIAVVSIMALSLPAFEANAKPRGASAFAPGQLAKRPGAQPARYYAPGQQAKRLRRPARSFAPGQR
jgi:hypothetical protein